MGEITWGSLGQWFSGLIALGALLYVLFREQVWERRKRPRLLLNPARCRDQRNTRLPNKRIDPSVSRWVRIPVQDEQGRKVAKNCRVYLIGVRLITADGRVVSVMENDVRQFQWEHGNYQPESRDLLPGVVHQVDLVAASDAIPTLSVRVNPYLNLDIPGRYVFSVQVAAEETDSQTRDFTVDWSGTRESLQPVVSSTEVPLSTRGNPRPGTGAEVIGETSPSESARV